MAAQEETAGVRVEPQDRPELSFDPFLPPYFLALLGAAAVVLALRSYARSTRPLGWGRRLLLGLLRAAAALIVLLCLARPVWVQAQHLSEKGLCFLVLDTSASMNLRDAPDERTRWEFAGALFSKHQKELAELGLRFDLRRLVFDVLPRETAQLPGEEAAANAPKPDGRATDLRALLERLAAEAGGAPCAGALLISDGRQTAPGDPVAAARKLERAGVPLFVAGMGQEATPADYREVQVRLLEVPERTFVGAQSVMKLEIESRVPGPLQTPLVVTVNGEKVLEETLALPLGQELIRREISYTPSQVGMHRVLAHVAPLPKEASVNNNSRAAYFRVYRHRLGIWYVEGTPRKEFGALRAALQTAPNVALHALNAFSRLSGPERDLLPQTEEAWRDLKLVIAGDLPAQRFTSAQLDRLAKFVEEGGGFLMLGGIENFGAGGWQGTPLAGVLPVELGKDDGAHEGRLPLEPTAEGLAHPATRLSEDPARAQELWKKLPLLTGINAVRRVKPAARVLLTAGGQPLLVVQEFGKGRGAVFTGDATWQWVLKTGQEDTHKRFWRNLATWLAHSEYRDLDKAVFVETDRLQYALGDEVVLSAHVQETEALKGRLAGVRVVATLELEGGAKRTWEWGQGAGDFSARQHPPGPGHYSFKVEALNARGEVLGSDATAFHVEVPDLENDNPQADLRLLKRLAVLSGGAYYDAGLAAEAFQQLLRRPAGFSKTVQESTEVWNHWTLFLAFLILVNMEWLLRRRWGLV